MPTVHLLTLFEWEASLERFRMTRKIAGSHRRQGSRR
jgi:hypothetical protein